LLFQYNRNNYSIFRDIVSKAKSKANEKLLTVLNTLLADELTAKNQYMAHSEIETLKPWFFLLGETMPLVKLKKKLVENK